MKQLGKKIGLILVFTMIASLAAYVNTVPLEAKTYQWKLQSAVPLPHMIAICEKWFCDEVKKRSNGQMTIDFYPALGFGIKAANILQAVGDGLIESAGIGGGHCAGEIRVMEIMELPGLVPYDVHLRKKVAKALFPYWEKELLKKNVVLLAFCQVDPRNIYSKRPINTLADLKGVKIRSMGAAENVVIKALGGTPAVVAWGEVYTALAQGVVDGYGVTNTATWSNKLYEVCSYCFELQWGGYTTFLGVTMDFFEKLPANLQKTLREVGHEAYERLWEMVATENKLYREKLMKEKGMKYTIAPSEAHQLIDQAGLNYSKEWIKLAGSSAPLAEEMLKLTRSIVKP
jgi:TRAP-type C4-dicarboxylate transport system substrate-binding protein